MKKIFKAVIMSICILAGSLGTANAQLLWKVEKPGSDKVSYLLGTHHFAPVDILDSISGLHDALESVDKLYGEIDMQMMSDPMQMMKFMDRLQAPADSTLDKICTPEELDSINVVWTRVTKGQAPLSMVYGMKPAVISTQMMAMIMAERFGELANNTGIDALMQNMARDMGKEVNGLETMEFQMNLLYCTPISEQKENLMEGVRDGGDKEYEQTIRLTNAYLKRDLDTLEQMMTDPDTMTPEDADRMIFNRNDNWVEILKTEMLNHPVMVVVGAGHLPAERGVINSLRKEGFIVTPID